MPWYRGNTHTHTSATPASDANGSPEFVRDWYRERGYSFLFITDHEVLTDVAALNDDPEFLVLPGQEITQMVLDPAHPHGIRQGHVNGLGTNRVILPVGFPVLPLELDAVWRAAPAGTKEALFAQRPDIAAILQNYPTGDHTLASTYDRNLREVRAAGGIPQVNHPNLHWSVAETDLDRLEGPYLMEVWNSFSIASNLGGVDEQGTRRRSTEELWDALLTSGRVVWGTATDDGHEYEDFADREAPTPGKGWILVNADELTPRAIMAALASGRFAASTGVLLSDVRSDGSSLELDLEPSMGWRKAKFEALGLFTTRFIGPGGELLAEVHGRRPSYNFRGDEAYVRASVIDSDGRRAWTQPVFRDGRLG